MSLTFAKLLHTLLSPLLPLRDRPVLYRGAHFQIVGYGLFAALASISVVCTTVLYLAAKGEQLPQSFFFLIPLLGFGVWLGSKLMHILALGRRFFTNPVKYLTETGFYVQGGIFGAVVGATGIAHLTGVSMVLLADGLAWGAMLGLVFGRLGCFSYGCCWGRPSADPAAGVCYHNHEVKALRLRPELEGVALYPTQLYTAALHASAFVLTWLAIQMPLPNGLVAGGFLVYHGVSRLLLERLRGDIYFDGQRNWTTFYAASSMVLTGVLMLAAGPFVADDFLALQPLAAPLRLYTLGALLVSQPLLPATLAILAPMILVGYGLHGRKLGTYPWSPENRAIATRHSEVRR